MSRKVKVVKVNPEPARGTVGVNPSDPWSAKANIAEASLDTYLLSRGINPKFVSKNTKISHSKSAHFQKWKSNHKFEEVQQNDVESLEEDAMLDKYLSSRGINPKFATKMIKISHAKSHEFEKWKRDHMFEDVVTEETDKKDMICLDIPLLIRVLEFTREDMKTDIELHNMVERLINMRANVPLDMSHYDEITQKLVKENHIAIAMGNMLDDEGSMVLSQLEQLERAITMIRSYIGKDYEKQLPAWVQAKVTLATDYIDTVGNYITSKNEKVTEEIKPTGLDKFRQAAAEREKKHDEVEKKRLELASRSKERMTSAIDRLQTHLNKEETEQIDEIYGPTQLDHDTVKKHLKNILAIDSDEPTATSAAHAAIMKVSTIGKSTTKSSTRQMLGALIRKHKIPIDQHHRALLNKESVEPTNENTLDSLAATEAPCDGANGGDDSSERKRQLSKSARIIKSLYKKHNMKEEMYDWEKDDKNQTSPGKKKLKLDKAPEESNFGSNKPQARAVMSGGKTMTGEKRDVVEIDPLLKNRPDLNGNLKDDGSKKNNKINN